MLMIPPTRPSWLTVHDRVGRAIATHRAERKAADAALREESERLYPYGPPPPLVDPERFSELATALDDSQFVAGIHLSPWQIRAMAGFIADRTLIEETQP